MQRWVGWCVRECGVGDIRSSESCLDFAMHTPGICKERVAASTTRDARLRRPTRSMGALRGLLKRPSMLETFHRLAHRGLGLVRRASLPVGGVQVRTEVRMLLWQAYHFWHGSRTFRQLQVPVENSVQRFACVQTFQLGQLV